MFLLTSPQVDYIKYKYCLASGVCSDDNSVSPSANCRPSPRHLLFKSIRDIVESKRRMFGKSRPHTGIDDEQHSVLRPQYTRVNKVFLRTLDDKLSPRTEYLRAI